MVDSFTRNQKTSDFEEVNITTPFAMGLPFPIRSATTLDCFTPLHVDTNIEYALDIDTFPELSEHHWEPALVIAPHNEYVFGVSDVRPEVMSSSNLISDENLQELSHLIDTYDICNLQDEDVDFHFADLPPAIQQSVQDSTGVYLESSLTSDLELSIDSVSCEMAATDSGFVSETEKLYDHEKLPEEIVITCEETSYGLWDATAPSKRKRSLSTMCEQTETPTKVCKRSTCEDSDNSAQCHTSVCVPHGDVTFGITETHWFREAIYPAHASFDAESRQW